MAKWLGSLALAALGAGLAWAPAAAQRQGIVVNGTVRDQDGNPIPGAEVFLGNTSSPVVTDDRGLYRILDAPRGRQWIAVRRIGFEPARRSITLLSNQAHTLDLTMAALPVNLPPVVVEARSGVRSKRLADFWWRTRTGWGRFLTQDDLALRNAAELSQVVRFVLPHATLRLWEQETFDPWFPDARPYGSFVFRRCAPALSLDGRYPMEGWRVDELRVEEVEALEIYRPGLHRIPVEFGLHPRATQCGLVVVWRKQA